MTAGDSAGFQLTLEHWPLPRIVGSLHPENEKAHTVQLIEASIDRWGFKSPVELDERTELLGAGHGRCEALLLRKSLGKPAPAGVGVDEDGEWLIPIIRGWASENDEEAAAARVADNQTTIEGGFKPSSLLSTLLTAMTTPTGLAGVGFTEQNVLDLKAMLSPPPSLDDLAAEHPTPPERALWPKLTFQITSENRDRYFELVGRRAEADENENFGFMLECAERWLTAVETGAGSITVP